MDFGIRNHLSYSALDELLKLLTFISPDQNHLPRSLHRLKSQYSSDNLNRTKFCSECRQVVPPTQKNCASRLCKEMKADVCWFIHVPIKNQIKILFEGEESIFYMSINLCTFIDCWDILQYPHKRLKDINCLQDIHDGSVISELSKPGRFLSYPEHTGLILNTDGVATFKSTKHSLWPVYLAVTNLPPHLRMRKEYVLLGGVWFGLKKPNMSVFLKPILEEVEHLYFSGVDVKVPDGTKTVRVKLLLAVFDLPAKAAVLNLKQYNGRYGCLYCTNPGRSMAPGCTVYVPSDQQNATERTHSLMTAWASDAEKKGESVFGVKGHSVLGAFIDTVNGVPIDYMHSILEGVTKYFTNMWLNSKNHKNSFYLGRMTKSIDRLLVRLKPPAQFHRSPRSINDIKFWKAAEFRAWLLFYSLPILKDFLPTEYVHHWSLLVLSIHMLLLESITKDHIVVADSCLTTFYQMVPELYGENACTSNVHSIVHMTRMVKLWGPLWTHSLFGFESMNGHIQKLFHGTRQVLDQLVFYVTAHQCLFFQTQKLIVASEKDYFHSFRHSGTADCCFEGRSHKVSLPNDLHAAIQLFVGQSIPNEHLLSSKFRKGSILFSSMFFTHEKSRDSSVCIYQQGNGEVMIGRIQIFDIHHKVAVLTRYKHVGGLLSCLRRSRKEKLAVECDKLHQRDIFHIVQEDKGRYTVISLHSIVHNCVVLEDKNNSVIVVKSPNQFEFH